MNLPDPISGHDEHYGTLNLAAPPELSRFAFLIGHWRCEAKIKTAADEWQTLAASSLTATPSPTSTA